MKRKPKPTPKRLYHATDSTGNVTVIKATDYQDALAQAFRTGVCVHAPVKVEAK